MNRRGIYYFPVLAYTFLLLFVWLLSWVVGVVGIVEDGNSMNSLMTAEGLRWAVRNSILTANDAPWGTAMLVLVIIGLLDGSGFLRLLDDLLHRRPVTVNSRRAAFAALFVLVLYIVVLCLCVVAPWRLLMGVTDSFSSSPMSRGWLLLSFFGVLFFSFIYGYVYGNFRSATDVVHGVGLCVARFVPALLAMLPATALLSCVRYMNLFAWVGVDDAMVASIADVVYLLPFLFVALMLITEKKHA